MLKKFSDFISGMTNRNIKWTPKQVMPVWIALYLFVLASLWMSIRMLDIAHIAIDGYVALKMTIASAEIIKDIIDNRHR